MKRILLIAILSLALVYGFDYLSLRYRIPRNRPQFGSVQVDLSYAVRLKDSKTAYLFDEQPQTQPCVHSLFPHLGDNPCWYVERHRRQQVEVR